jgi:hypothetical protein
MRVIASFVGSRRRSTADRLVPICRAISALEIFRRFIALEICHARTALIARAEASSKRPCSLRKASSVDPSRGFGGRAVRRLAASLLREALGILLLPKAFAALGELQVLSGGLPRLLEEAMEKHEPAVAHQEDRSRRPTSPEIRAKLVESLTQRPCERHTHGPAVLEALEIAAQHAPVLLGKSAQPLPDRLATRAAAEEDRGEPLQVGQSVPKMVLPSKEESTDRGRVL